MSKTGTKISLIKIAIILMCIKATAFFSIVIPWNSLIDNLVNIFFIFVCLVKLKSSRIKVSTTIVFGLISLFVLYTCYITKEYDLLITLLAIFMVKDEKMDEILKVMLYTETAILIYHIVATALLSALGLGGEFWLSVDSRAWRYSAGFNHPNVLATFCLSLIMMMFYVRYKHITKADYLIGFMMAFLIYIFTRSRTSAGILALFIFAVSLSRYPKIAKLYKPITVILPPILSLMNVFLIQGYMVSNKISILVNNVLSGRITLAAYAYTKSGMTLLPKYLSYFGSIPYESEWGLTSFTFDNIYAYCLMNLGSIWIIFLTIIVFFYVKKNNLKHTIYMMIWLIYGMTEVHGTNCFKFFPLILLATLLQPGGIQND